MNGRKNLIGWLLWLTVTAIWGLVVYVVLLASPTPVVSRTWPDGGWRGGRAGALVLRRLAVAL